MQESVVWGLSFALPIDNKGASQGNLALERGAYPRVFATRPYAASFVKVSIPQPVCLTSRISTVPRSCSEMTMLRRASTAEAPACRNHKVSLGPLFLL